MGEECAVMFTLAMFEEIYFLVVKAQIKGILKLLKTFVSRIKGWNSCLLFIFPQFRRPHEWTVFDCLFQLHANENNNKNRKES